MEVSELINIIHADPGLSSSQKEELTGAENKKRLPLLLSGATGAALGLALAKYNKLGRTAQILLSVLGFGAGTLLYKHYSEDKFMKYDEKKNLYQIDNK